MRDLDNVKQGQREQSDANEQGGRDGVTLNYDVQSYQFHDPDLAMAADRLSRRDQVILVLHLMGHTQSSIAGVFFLSRSMISKRLTAIARDLRQQLNQSTG